MFLDTCYQLWRIRVGTSGFWDRLSARSWLADRITWPIGHLHQCR